MGDGGSGMRKEERGMCLCCYTCKRFSVKDSCGGGIRLKRSDDGSLRWEK